MTSRYGQALGLAIITVLASLPRSATAQWYTQATYSCSGMFAPGNSALSIGGPFFSKALPLQFVSPSQGKLYADLSAAAVFKAPTILQQEHVYEEVVLDAAGAGRLRPIVDGEADNLAVPLIVQNLPSLTGYLMTNTASLVISGFFSYLFDEIGTQRITVSQMLPLVAAGGRLRHYITLQSAGERYFLLSTHAYEVSVGNEQRRVLLRSCTYPATLRFEAFRTTAGVNDKFIRRSGDRWLVSNVSNGATQPGHLVKTSEDSSFLYFRGVNFSAFFTDYRIGKMGGPFEVRTESGWTNLYATTQPIDP